VPVNIAELERRARRLLTPEVYDYYAGGAGRERTLRANVGAWRQYWLLPRVFRDVSAVDTSVRLPGLPEVTAATPVAIAPTGFQGLASAEGELATVRGAAAAGALTVVSSRSSRRIEDIGRAAADAGGAWWFQVYLLRDRDLTARMVSRAVAAGARALVLTGDTPVVGHKRRDRGESLFTEAEFLVNTGPLADLAQADQAADLSFADIGWLARLGDVPVLVKGVLRPDDARACLDAGAAGVIVSNHGGRQLDRAVPTAYALPAVATELARGGDGACPGRVYADGGLRSGEDVLTALGLGAHAVFLGRPVLWALACDGADGVRDLLTGITADLAHAMALAGARTLADVAGVTAPTTAHSLDT
jgi:4-hydroxymandelate oxidase